jgi:hypothetical protein
MEAMPYILSGVILPLTIGGVLAYLYPDLRAYVIGPPASLRRRRAENLLEEYRTTRQNSGDTFSLVLHVISHMARLLGQLATLILITALHLNYLFGDFLGFILYGFITTSCLVQVNVIHNIINNSNAFNIYREKTLAELKRLGVNPEDLDKEVFGKQGS